MDAGVGSGAGTYAVATLAGLVLAVMVLLTHFLPWHDVATPDWGGAFCWVPDCRPQGGASATLERCKGTEDAPLGSLMFGLLAIGQAFAVARRRRPILWLAWVLALWALAAAVLSSVEGVMAHFLSSASATGGFAAFGVLSVLLVLATSVQLVLAWRWRVESRRAASARS